MRVEGHQPIDGAYYWNCEECGARNFDETHGETCHECGTAYRGVAMKQQCVCTGFAPCQNEKHALTREAADEASMFGQEGERCTNEATVDANGTLVCRACFGTGE